LEEGLTFLVLAEVVILKGKTVREVKEGYKMARAVVVQAGEMGLMVQLMPLTIQVVEVEEELQLFLAVTVVQGFAL
jgi:hypothetical protein